MPLSYATDDPGKYGRWTCARIALLAVLLAAPAGSARALDIDEIRWGFDGQVVPHRFNVLSVLVNNPLPDAFDGVLTLERSSGAGRVGAPIAEPLFLAPYTSRWVQFTPYILDGLDEWRLEWGRRRGERAQLPPPRPGPPACVLLDPPQTQLRGSGSLKRLPDNLFPPSVTATDGLGAVVLDHSPRWEESRRQAFLDWLFAGGRVHVLRGSDGEWPRFPDELAVLNRSSGRDQVGAGRVQWHERDRNGLDRAFVAETIVGPVLPEPPRSGADPVPAGSGEADGLPTDWSDYTTGGLALAQWDSASTFFAPLKEMTKPDHNWPLIYLLSFVYVLAIFPGGYALAFHRYDYRAVYAVLLGTVALASVLFLMIGRRGYDEISAVSAVAIARPLADDACDVQQWTNAFVTTGGVYELVPSGTGVCYSTSQRLEQVNGLIHNGADAQFRVDIPPFSSRTFSHRARVVHPAPRAALQRFEPGPPASEIELIVNGLPEEIVSAAAVHGDQLYELDVNINRLTNVGNTRQLLHVLTPAVFDEYPSLDPWADESTSSADGYERLFLPLVARALGVSRPRDVLTLSLPSDRLRLFLYAGMPESFLLEGDAFRGQSGRVLYCLDLPLPESP